MNEFNYISEPKESVACTLCGGGDSWILSIVSKNGLPVKTCLCKQCGLIYINPRMTKEGYDAYYKYFYRKDRSIIKGREEPNEEENFQSARKFGNVLAKKLDRYMQPGLMVDVGSSTGGVLYGLREIVPSVEVFGIEPSVAESEFANKKGIMTECALFENILKDHLNASSIICVKSLNHLLNPRSFLEWARNNLKENGHIILAVKNFRQQVYRAGRVESAVQIDHPYMFVPCTLRRLVESSGFEVVFEDIDEKKSKEELGRKREEGLPRQHILLVARVKQKMDIRPVFDAKRALNIRRQLSPFWVRFRNILLRLRMA